MTITPSKVSKFYVVWLLVVDSISSLFFIKVIFTLYLQEKGLSLPQVSLFIALYHISKMALEIPTGIMADKYGQKRCSLIGMALYSLFIGLLYIGGPIPMVILVATAQGAAYACMSGSFSALLVDTLFASGGRDSLPFISTLQRVLTSVFMASGTLIGGVVAEAFSYGLVYQLQFMTFFLSFLLLLFAKEPPLMRKQGIHPVGWKVVLKYLINTPFILFLLFMTMGIAIAFISVDRYYPQFLIQRGIREEQVGLLLFCIQIAGALATLWFTKTSKIREKSYALLVKTAPFAMMVSLIFAFVFQDHLISYFFYFGGELFFILTNIIVFTYTHKTIPSEYRASIDSYFSLGLASAAIVSSGLFGWLSHYFRMDMIFIYLLILASILLLGNYLFFNRLRNKKDNHVQ